MKNLTLVRHGKSGYEIGLSDKQRTLNEKGIDNSIYIADKYLEYLPENYQLLSSTATRAEMTAKIFANIFKIDNNKIEFNDDLYTFDSNEFIKIIKNTDNNIYNLIVFGHNDAITDIANKYGNISIDNVPTSGLVSIDFDTDNWATISEGKTIKTIFPNKN